MKSKKPQVRRVPGQRNTFEIRFPAPKLGARHIGITGVATPEQWERLGSGKPHHRPKRPKRS